MANPITRKMGPLPVWAWGILGGIAVYFLFIRGRSSSGTTTGATGPTASVLDPNAVDPTTGLTYGQELAGNAPFPSGLGAPASSGSVDTGGTAALDGFDQQLQSFLQAQSDFSQLAGALGFAPPNPSQSTVAAAASAPLTNTNPPGAGTRPAVGSSAGARGAIVAPYGASKPPAKPGYRTVGTGAGGWIYVPVPQSHRQKTMFHHNPAPHQQTVKPKTSTAKPKTVKRPAGGGASGGVQTAKGSRPAGSSPTRTRTPVRPPKRRAAKPRRR